MRLFLNNEMADVNFEDGWVEEVWVDAKDSSGNFVRVNIGPWVSDKDCDNLIEQAYEKSRDFD